MNASIVGHYIGGQTVPGKAPASRSTTRHRRRRPPRRPGHAGRGGPRRRQRPGRLPAWADTPPIRRARVMFKFLELLNRHRDELAHMITAEHGKVFTDAQGEVSRGIDIVEFACGIPQLLRETTPNRSPPASTIGPCASRWAWWPASRPSTSR